MGMIIEQIATCDECEKEFDINTVAAYDEDFQKWFCSDSCTESYSRRYARDEYHRLEAERDEYYDTKRRAIRDGD